MVIIQGSQHFLMKNPEIQHLSEGANGGLGAEYRRFSGFFNKNKAFLAYIFALWLYSYDSKQNEDEVKLIQLDHDKLHNLFQSFISATASLGKMK